MIKAFLTMTELCRPLEPPEVISALINLPLGDMFAAEEVCCFIHFSPHFRDIQISHSVLAKSIV